MVISYHRYIVCVTERRYPADALLSSLSLTAALGSPPSSAAISHVPTFTGTPHTSIASTQYRPWKLLQLCQQGFCLSSQAPFLCAGISYPPISGKVVQKVKANEFIDLRELLPDNVHISLLEKLEGLPVAPGGTRPRLREVSSHLTWRICILKLIAIQAQNPDRVTQMCAYTPAWLSKKLTSTGEMVGAHTTACSASMPRQTQAMSWATLDGSIHAATFLALRTGSATHCRLCADSDHLAHECALAPLLNPHQPARPTSGQTPPSSGATRFLKHAANLQLVEPGKVCLRISLHL